MTSQEGTPPQIYIPTLHRELAGRPLPDGVLFLDPGLPETAEKATVFTPGNYPLSPREAAQVLSDLLSIGESLGLSGNIAAADAVRLAPLRGRLSPSDLSSEEARDIAKFGSPGKEIPEPAAPSPLIAAQKVLLLAWDLETRLAEIQILRQEVEKSARPLAEALRDPSEEDAVSAAIPGFIPDLPDNAEPDWRPTLAAMAAFLPKDATLITAHEDMRASLLERGMLLPLPEDTAQKLETWPESAKTSSLWVKAPLWRVIGHTNAPENAPWLAEAPEIIVCRPFTAASRTAQVKKGTV